MQNVFWGINMTKSIGTKVFITFSYILLIEAKGNKNNKSKEKQQMSESKREPESNWSQNQSLISTQTAQGFRHCISTSYLHAQYHPFHCDLGHRRRCQRKKFHSCNSNGSSGRALRPQTPPDKPRESGRALGKRRPSLLTPRWYTTHPLSLCVCVCVSVCVSARVCVCVCVCVRLLVWPSNTFQAGVVLSFKRMTGRMRRPCEGKD